MYCSSVTGEGTRNRARAATTSFASTRTLRQKEPRVSGVRAGISPPPNATRRLTIVLQFMYIRKHQPRPRDYLSKFMMRAFGATAPSLHPVKRNRLKTLPLSLPPILVEPPQASVTASPTSATTHDAHGARRLRALPPDARARAHCRAARGARAVQPVARLAA